jgi:methyl-accepting chemotaxis protein
LDEALKRTRQGLGAAENLSSSFSGIEKVFREAEAMMRVIIDSAAEETMAVDEAVRNVSGLDSLIKRNTDVVHMTKTNSGELSAQASQLGLVARQLMTVIDGRRHVDWNGDGQARR